MSACGVFARDTVRTWNLPEPVSSLIKTIPFAVAWLSTVVTVASICAIPTASYVILRADDKSFCNSVSIVALIQSSPCKASTNSPDSVKPSEVYATPALVTYVKTCIVLLNSSNISK